jgi:hypothetical protein
VLRLLEPLSQFCVNRHEGYWSYEFCYRRGIRQYHNVAVRDAKGACARVWVWVSGCVCVVGWVVRPLRVCVCVACLIGYSVFVLALGALLTFCCIPPQARSCRRWRAST